MGLTTPEHQKSLSRRIHAETDPEGRIGDIGGAIGAESGTGTGTGIAAEAEAGIRDETAQRLTETGTAVLGGEVAAPIVLSGLTRGGGTATAVAVAVATTSGETRGAVVGTDGRDTEVNSEINSEIKSGVRPRVETGSFVSFGECQVCHEAFFAKRLQAKM